MISGRIPLLQEFSKLESMGPNYKNIYILRICLKQNIIIQYDSKIYISCQSYVLIILHNNVFIKINSILIIIKLI